jgi:GH15 family glucan-1,4-alpha-glucosidase
VPSLIENYALIGDCRTAALVAKDGSIDWLCLPRFDSPACLTALLGTNEHGRWSIAPKGRVTRVERRYIEGTLILETEFEVDGGKVVMTDFMPPQTSASDIIRMVRGLSGEVQMRSELVVRFDYGSILPWIQRKERGMRATAGPDSVQLFSDLRQEIEYDNVVCDFVIAEGQTVAFQLTWTQTHAPEPLERNAKQTLDDATSWWRDWSDRCTYEGPWKTDVMRSLITLKGLTYAPTGGIVAAATTSLPEQIGGTRNWDYRYCWIRDATFTLLALLVGGYVEEANAWRQWLVNAAAGNPAQLQIMYGVAGERRLTELQLDWLPGYEGSKPVRTGNAAFCQHQLDVPGEIMESLHLARRRGLSPSDEAWRVQQAVMEFLNSQWEQPDEGIWEIRGPRRHFTHSKVMAWVAADRAVKDIEQFGLPGDANRWRTLRDKIHRQVCAEGYDTELKAFVQSYGSKEPDASLLMLPLVGFVDAKDPRMTGTVKLIESRLVHDGLVERYATDSNVDGLPAGEGAFLLCSFWLADNYALSGRETEAHDLFQMLLNLRNDVGLLSEEYDPHAKRMVGNFPQAFSHVGLVNTARYLSPTQPKSQA